MSDDNPASRVRLVAVFAMIGTIAWVTAVIGINEGFLSAAVPSKYMALPFVWRDVAVVCLLSTMPVAWLLGNMAVRRLNPYVCILAAVLLWCACCIVFVRFQDSPKNLPSFPAISRLLAALCVTTGISLVTRTLIIPLVEHPKVDRPTAFLRLVCSLAVLALVPAVYMNARSRHDAEQFFSLREQSRFGEAQWLLHRMLMLDPQVQVDGQRLKREQRETEQTVEALSLQVQRPLSATADLIQRLTRARTLAMLGRTEEALTILPENDETFQSAQACILLGTIFENRQDWDSAMRLYAIAQTLLHSAPERGDSAAESYQVTMGLAYCSRRLGRLSEARAHYLSLLTIEPSADTHFLLAQFFEDIQETETARKHTQLAIQADPDRYREKGQALIRKMQSLHFGCFRVIK